MAHFAKLDENNFVDSVVVISNIDVIDKNNNNEESEELGIDVCKNLFGQDTRWVQTSYNGNIRYNFAGIGYFYDENADAFIPPKPYNSWILNTETYRWDSPVPMPNDGNMYMWDENTLAWNLIQ